MIQKHLDFYGNIVQINQLYRSTGQADAAGTKDVEIMVSLKHLNFWRTLEMLLINCEISLLLTWPGNCVQAIYCYKSSNNVCNKINVFNKRYTKRYVPDLTFSTQDNTKLLQELKSGFKRTIKWNIHQSKVTMRRQNQYFDFLIDPSFHVVNRLFVL